ncbi:MAG: diacylglycerol/lipid kinase family protein [Anaerolineae bacterium]
MTDEAAPPETAPSSAFVVLNPVGGRSDPDATAKALEQHLGGNGWRYELYQTTGKEDVPSLVRDAAKRGFAIVVAAGGDGTVSDVVNGLMGTDATLGIVPLGTGNMLARELSIPLDLEQACALIAGAHGLARIDVMQVGDRYFILNLSVGLSAVAMRETPKASKHRFGMVAYIWTALRNLAGLEPRRYRLQIDTFSLRSRASEILITNGVIPGKPLLGTTGECALTDGKLSVYVMRARSLFSYVIIGVDLLRGRERRNPLVRYFEATDWIRIEATPPVVVQADGDAAGQTPVEVHLVRQALATIVPADFAAAVCP